MGSSSRSRSRLRPQPRSAAVRRPSSPRSSFPFRVVAIFGPTASGKSDVAAALAERIPADVISADAMQAYRGLPILTNQDERHTQLVGIWPLDHEGSVAEYQRLAHEAIDGVLAQERLAVVVGGTGLYLRAAVSNLELPPPPDAGVRERLEAVYERVGGERAHALLAERDPPAAAHVHPNDRRRVVRALELVEAGASLRPEADRLWSSETRHPTLFVGLDVPREELARRIDTRTQAMFERGVEEEARRALESPISATASMIVGLREIAELPREQAAEAIALRTRRYAAYQRKWMRRIPGLVTVRGGRPAGEIADEILQVARARQHVPAGHGG
ncbi:MAG: tRNA (adenosine(37)-N6)-dimethylallyltransferase MiaA [Actinobacteria bacterium]|nr:tRNA (adenosine(37)-N6)-dimethylallyltransferase MiaA [Actinomycetota bacterium]